MYQAVQIYLKWFMEEETSSFYWFAGYFIVKLLLKLLFAKKKMSVQQVTVHIWDPICLLHNILSVVLGSWAIWIWKGDHANACSGISDEAALVITLQACHSVSDFLIFLPQLLNEPVLFVHHFILIIVSLVLPYCKGCYYVVIAFSIAEFGSGAIAVDGEWRKAGGTSRGFTRVLIFGLSRVVNLYFLYRIWLVTPYTSYLLNINNSSNNIQLSLKSNICMITSCGGGALMLAVNGLTWWRMLQAYLKRRKKRKAKVQ